MLTHEEVQKRAMVRMQVMELYDTLDRELLLLMGGLAPGGVLEAAAAAVAAAATKRTAALIESIGSAHPCK